MVFGPPQHGPLRLAYGTPQVRTFYERPLRVGGASPQQRHIEITDSPFAFVRRTAEA